MSSATGLARQTIRNGRKELEEGVEIDGRIRRPGAGRPGIEETQPGVTVALEKLVEPLTRGDPMSALRWTCKSRANLTAELLKNGWKISSSMVGRLLNDLGYSLQSLRKSTEGVAKNPDRNAQFEHINATAESFLQRNLPVISVDTEKKELAGDFKNAGQESQRKGEPGKVWVHDFPGDPVGKAIPYGVYDLGRNEASVSVGRDRDTPAFAAASIRHWWKTIGRPAYPGAKELFITADAGGGNSDRARAWRIELQGLADEFSLVIQGSHFPPGTSKWNKIEHRLFCHITRSRRGRPLTTREAIVALIGSIRTTKRQRVKARPDKRKDPTGVAIPNNAMNDLSLHHNEFHGEWNYELRPRRS